MVLVAWNLSIGATDVQIRLFVNIVQCCQLRRHATPHTPPPRLIFHTSLVGPHTWVSLPLHLILPSLPIFFLFYTPTPAGYAFRSSTKQTPRFRQSSHIRTQQPKGILSSYTHTNTYDIHAT